MNRIYEIISINTFKWYLIYNSLDKFYVKAHKRHIHNI